MTERARLAAGKKACARMIRNDQELCLDCERTITKHIIAVFSVAVAVAFIWIVKLPWSMAEVYFA